MVSLLTNLYNPWYSTDDMLGHLILIHTIKFFLDDISYFVYGFL